MEKLRLPKEYGYLARISDLDLLQAYEEYKNEGGIHKDLSGKYGTAIIDVIASRSGRNLKGSFDNIDKWLLRQKGVRLQKWAENEEIKKGQKIKSEK